ncbi:hypothetical protein GGR56DRAFT_673500 [Xylariaceae sp. FL0804]|nr:hypothetical protein GGR56DRAFT_673500 [Xylariaceae sp. FL0804]
MAPSQPQPVHARSQAPGTTPDESTAVAPMQNTQPGVSAPMDPERPHPESEMGLRGGDRGGCCPGRFCFCIPCPLPCDFCII